MALNQAGMRLLLPTAALLGAAEPRTGSVQLRHGLGLCLFRPARLNLDRTRRRLALGWRRIGPDTCRVAAVDGRSGSLIHVDGNDRTPAGSAAVPPTFLIWAKQHFTPGRADYQRQNSHRGQRHTLKNKNQ